MADGRRGASTAPPPSGPLHRERYTIIPDFDHILVVIPSTIITRFVNGVFEERKGPPQAAYEFEVKLEALHKMAFFRRTIPVPEEKPVIDLEDKTLEGRTLQDKLPQNDASQDRAAHSTSELHDDDPRAWRLWLEMLHGCLNVSSYQAQIVTVWHVLQIAEKYDINPTCADAGAWFDEWFFAQSARGLFTSNENIRQILFPCHRFDHALGFSTSTMWLAYNCTGHVQEKRPKEFESHPHLGLDRGIERTYRRSPDLCWTSETDCQAEQMNAARGRLKSILHRKLYDCVDELLSFATCQLRKDVLWGYFFALNRTRSWPLERWAKVYSIHELLENLEAFEYEDPHPYHRCRDRYCGQDFTLVVRRAINHTGSHFDGLCLGEKSSHVKEALQSDCP